MPNAQPTTKELIAMLYERLPELFERSQQKPLTDERPAQQALEKMADNARELGLDYEPVQEPVASIFISGIGEREFDDWGHDLPVGRNLLYTSPPASKPLTGEQIRALWEQEAKPERSTAHFFTAFARAIETAHGIKENT